VYTRKRWRSTDGTYTFAGNETSHAGRTAVLRLVSASRDFLRVVWWLEDFLRVVWWLDSRPVRSS